jgi:hypothetical protein
VSRVRDERDRFGRLIDDTAQTIGLDPSLVEKDYWAVEALRAVQHGFDVEIAGQTTRVMPIFKGGTSLSKAFGLIERFSEDVDFLVPVPFDSADAYSQSQRTDVMRAMTDAVSAALGIDGEREGGRKGVDRHWRYPFEQLRASAVGGEVEASIRVEVTVMGGQNPKSVKSIRAMVADRAVTIEGFPTYEDLTPVTIETLAPERTLVEKLALLHDAAYQALDDKPKRLQGAGRHYYDVARLLQSDAVRSSLTPEWVAAVAADADRWSDRGNFPFTPRPDTGFAASPAFNDAASADIVAESYRVALSWVWGPKPTLEECLATIRENVERL